MESSVVIRKSPEDVWNFLEDVSNLPKWDRGVATVRLTSPGTPVIGAEFDTLPHPRRPGDGLEWGRMSYRVTRLNEADRYAAVQVISKTGNARYFRTAVWRIHVEPVLEGSRVFCSADFTLRPRYWFLAPILYSAKRAIRADLDSLRRVLESS